MRFRFVLVAAALTAMTATVVPWPAQAAPPTPAPGTTCTWGGTAAAPTGTFTITPGLTNTPLATPARFYATGVLAGGAGCDGTFTYVGRIDASGTCSASTFEGRANGIPSVTDFAGVGAGPFAPARLYDRNGNIVASETANVNTQQNMPHYLDCDTPGGFTGGDFSSTIVFVDQKAGS